MDWAAFRCHARTGANDVLFFYYTSELRARKSVDKLRKFLENILWHFKTCNNSRAFDASNFYVAPFITRHKPNENLWDLRNIAASKQQKFARWRAVRSGATTAVAKLLCQQQTQLSCSTWGNEKWRHLAGKCTRIILKSFSDFIICFIRFFFIESSIEIISEHVVFKLNFPLNWNLILFPSCWWNLFSFSY